MTVLVTGAAGFIGMHVCRLLLQRGERVVGLDNLNDYYDPRLKQARLKQLQPFPKFEFVRGDVAEALDVQALFRKTAPDRVVHLAAQAGVRYSLKRPDSYVQSNLVGFANILEACRHAQVRHLVYASSSSVYGANTKMPFSVHDRVDHPISLYAATKKSNELMAHCYSHLFGLPTTGLRFFTVYGPWGRPDMAPWLFSSAILEGRPISIFNEGRMRRDFTYVDDIAEGTLSVLDHVATPYAGFETDQPDPGTGQAPYRIFNIGNHQPVELLTFVEILEKALGREAIKQFMPMQPGDVQATYADIDDLRREVGFEPTTPLPTGLARWAAWYRSYQAQIGDGTGDRTGDRTGDSSEQHTRLAAV
jgi:UDP-glucuronate 4-epimerase